MYGSRKLSLGPRRDSTFAPAHPPSLRARTVRPGWTRVALCLIAWCAELSGGRLPLIHAQTVVKPNVTLAWRAPSECMSEQSAQRNLRGLIGEPAAQAPGAAVSVEISARADGYLAKIAFSGALLGTRQLTGPRCDTLSDAALLIVAITAAPQAVAERASPGRERTSTPDAALHWRVGLALRADIGSLPALSPGAGLELGFSVARLNAGLTAGYFLPRVQLKGPRPDVGARVDLWDLALRGGVDLVRTRDVGFGPTASLIAGVESATPIKVRRANPKQRAPWLAGALGLQLRGLLAPLLLQAGAELGVSVLQPEFNIDGYGQVFQSSLWFGRLWFGVAWTSA